jgi:hypothetical protein
VGAEVEALAQLVDFFRGEPHVAFVEMSISTKPSAFASKSCCQQRIAVSSVASSRSLRAMGM